MRIGLGLLLLALAGASAAAEISGTVTLQSGGKALRAEEARDAVVYFRPRQRVAVSVPREPPVMSTERKQFVPRVLAVPVGATVRFPNNDPILHNVFAPPGPNQFDTGLIGKGEREVHTFTSPGLVRVYCNVHHDMVAHVLVLDTPFVARPDASGRFVLTGVPLLEGELFVWHERARVWRRGVDGPLEADLQIALELNRPRVPAHVNKFGKPYGSDRGSGY